MYLMTKGSMIMKKHLNIFFPQWQGGGQDKSTYEGAIEIKKKYLSAKPFIDVEVSLEDDYLIENNIIGYKSIMKQLEECKKLIMQEKPTTIFTIGGGCDISIVPVSYLNSKIKGDITILWFDAHGDLNTPESSYSKAFHGMPLRMLLGEGDSKLLSQAFSILLPSQIILLGSRELDDAEVQYIEDKNIKLLTVEDIESNINNVLETIKSKGSENIYIHMDLDVIDPVVFPFVPVPAVGGLKIETLSSFLKVLDREFNILGLSLVEYQPAGKPTFQILEKIINMGVAL
ncbi:arginase [Pelosinus fermentans]|uniref:Arginase/agmatinase/formiminoglutamase n=3 Tax=Pelosinus TaxID=365348 RepID=I9LEC7_9FIRM|nr:Arginase/agmatinase/formiminoglutamase [Pelosinus fermentans B4]EIW21991.1 Arginase/agmatinase/formiminoglutamase [Pelosinus fermentans A11]OAM95158.1 Arginase/agmatinase/formiminoglutamase [Pelosinus fermentans DSM 17108]SDR24111.1 arginase [Pelosinus fermentans]